MNDNNIFDYATKELSQDAFLRWLFEKYDDPEVGEVSRSLIAKLVSLGGKPIDQNQINTVKTWSQIKKIDIIVDFYVGNTKSIMIIEDKTTSDPHDNQLIRYKNEVISWNKGEDINRPTYFIYYKTNALSDEEENQIKETKVWKAFDISNISDFFYEYRNHTNLIISSYAKHVEKIQQKLNSVSTLPVKDWDYTNGLTFFREKVEPIFRKYHSNQNNDKKVSELDVHQGTYSSSRFYYTFSNQRLKDKYYPLVEFIFRNGTECIDVYAHCSFRDGDYWTWKWQDQNIIREDKGKIVEDIQNVFVNIGFKKKNISKYRAQTIATYKLDKEKSIDELISAIDYLIHSFVDGFDKYDKGMKDV